MPLPSFWTIKNILTHALFGLCCFYAGLLAGMSTYNRDILTTTATECPACPKAEAAASPCPPCPVKTNSTNIASKTTPKCSTCPKAAGDATFSFPHTMDKMFVDFATVPRDDFNALFDIGVPLDDTVKGAEDVLMLYPDLQTLPLSAGGNRSSIPAQAATQNCNTLKVILTQPNAKQCFALVPQWESYYVHKFMRLPTDKGGITPSVPLRYVSRAHDADKGNFERVPDLKAQTTPFYAVLKDYLEHLPRLLQDLKPVLEIAAAQSSSNSKTLLVQVCNYGQVELFHNFVCTAKARGIAHFGENMIMFATDQATYDLCQKLGIPAFYDSAIFGDLPEQAAHFYGDRVFSKMMMAKVYCVHLALTSGYNVLFQDVDVVWYKNPLPYFDSAEVQEWDMMFQDDGGRSYRFAPYSPNTGFYFVRHNANTVFFFNMLLRMGDVITQASSHQAALTALLNEHVSWKGLRVKVWPKGEGNAFPGGVEYHQRSNFMKALFLGKLSVDPYLFHMSWTLNKDNKKLYYQQMGEWHLKEGCVNGYECCLAQPNITCSYSDKPSKIPCRDSPPIDKGKPSFWKIGEFPGEQ